MKKIVVSLFIIAAFASCSASKDSVNNDKEEPEVKEKPTAPTRDSRGNYLR